MAHPNKSNKPPILKEEVRRKIERGLGFISAVLDMKTPFCNSVGQATKKTLTKWANHYAKWAIHLTNALKSVLGTVPTQTIRFAK